MKKSEKTALTLFIMFLAVWIKLPMEWWSPILFLVALFFSYMFVSSGYEHWITYDFGEAKPISKEVKE